MFVWISLTLPCFDCFKSGSWWQNLASHYLVSQRQSVVVLTSENGLLFIFYRAFSYDVTAAILVYQNKRNGGHIGEKKMEYRKVPCISRTHR